MVDSISVAPGASTHAPRVGGELADNPSCKMKVSASTHASRVGANLLC